MPHEDGFPAGRSPDGEANDYTSRPTKRRDKSTRGVRAESGTPWADQPSVRRRMPSPLARPLPQL
jgi:hypothetical protein